MTKIQHVVPADDQWAVRAENSERPSKVFKTKTMAVAHAYDIAANNDGYIVVHDAEGKIQKYKAASDTNKLVQMLAA